MKAQVYHFQINVRDAARSLPFYKALLGYLEYRTVYESDTVAGFSGSGADIWVIATEPAHAGHGFHRKRPGLNHVGASGRGGALSRRVHDPAPARAPL